MDENGPYAAVKCYVIYDSQVWVIHTHIWNHATPHAKTHTSISYKQALCLPLSHQIFNPFGCTVNQRETHVIVNLTANLEKRRMECKETPKFEWTFFSYYYRCTHTRRRRIKTSKDVPGLQLEEKTWWITDHIRRSHVTWVSFCHLWRQHFTFLFHFCKQSHMTVSPCLSASAECLADLIEKTLQPLPQAHHHWSRWCLLRCSAQCSGAL